MADVARSPRRNTRLYALFCSLALPALAGLTAHAQPAEATARQVFRVKAYGMFSYVDPDYGGARRNTGATVGVDIDVFRLLPYTELGLDLRTGASAGPITNQYMYGGGPRFAMNLGRVKPYVDVLFGQGRGTFKTSTESFYTHDNSRTIDYGGGLDYQLSRFWAVRADIQRERWDFSVHQPVFSPTAASVGVSYQVHFRSRTGPNW